MIVKEYSQYSFYVYVLFGLKMFYLIGLGLGDPKDITVKGLEVVRQCNRVYLEGYTSILACPITELVRIGISWLVFYLFLLKINTNDHFT